MIHINGLMISNNNKGDCGMGLSYNLYGYQCLERFLQWDDYGVIVEAARIGDRDGVCSLLSSFSKPNLDNLDVINCLELALCQAASYGYLDIVIDIGNFVDNLASTKKITTEKATKYKFKALLNSIDNYHHSVTRYMFQNIALNEEDKYFASDKISTKDKITILERGIIRHNRYIWKLFYNSSDSLKDDSLLQKWLQQYNSEITTHNTQKVGKLIDSSFTYLYEDQPFKNRRSQNIVEYNSLAQIKRFENLCKYGAQKDIKQDGRVFELEKEKALLSKIPNKLNKAPYFKLFKLLTKLELHIPALYFALSNDFDGNYRSHMGIIDIVHISESDRNNILRLAIQNNNVKAVESFNFLNQSHVRIADSDMFYILGCTIRSGNTENIKFMLSSEYFASLGATKIRKLLFEYLIYAVHINDYRIVKCLMQQIAYMLVPTNRKDKNHFNDYLYTIAQDRLIKDEPAYQTAVILSASIGDNRIFDFFLNLKKNIKASDDIIKMMQPDVNACESAILRVAVFANNISAVEKLLKNQKIDIFANQEEALTLAISGQYNDIFKMLISHIIDFQQFSQLRHHTFLIQDINEIKKKIKNNEFSLLQLVAKQESPHQDYYKPLLKEAQQGNINEVKNILGDFIK